MKRAAEEMRSATSLMILLHWMIKEYRHTKVKSRNLNVLVVNLNGKERIVLCNTKSIERRYVSALDCEDWVKHKDRIFDQGWCLFDHDGYLN